MQNSQENTSASVSFLIKLQTACIFTKKETLTQVFSCEFCENRKNTFFTEHLWETASILIHLIYWTKFRQFRIPTFFYIILSFVYLRETTSWTLDVLCTINLRPVSWEMLTLYDQCSHHIKTSQLICRVNQLTGFYMKGGLVGKGLKQQVFLFAKFRFWTEFKIHTIIEKPNNWFVTTITNIYLLSKYGKLLLKKTIYSHLFCLALH